MTSDIDLYRVSFVLQFVLQLSQCIDVDHSLGRDHDSRYLAVEILSTNETWLSFIFSYWASYTGSYINVVPKNVYLH